MENPVTDKNLIRNLDNRPEQTQFSSPVFIGLLITTIAVGVGVGYLMNTVAKINQKSSSTSNTKTKRSVGIVDKKTFKDSAEGKLEEGGIDGEGNFHLVRKGGESQNVYLTSTTVDLSEFIGKKVRVWGETFQGEKAGWLMDVGLVEVLQ